MNDATKPKRYQCRHIFVDGTRCGSPCLRGEQFCYYHHTTRRPIQNPTERQSRRSSFDLPLPEDRSAIQASIGQVLQRIAANQIDPRRAGLLLYGLQIASLNLPKPETSTRSRNSREHSRQSREPEVVEEITTHPELGTLAPILDFDEAEQSNRKPSAMRLLMDAMMRGEEERAKPAIAQPRSEPAITEPQPTQKADFHDKSLSSGARLSRSA